MNTTVDYKALAAHRKTPEFWGGFDPASSQHRYILSLMHQLDWTKPMEGRPVPVPDTERLGKWLQSEKSPVKKALRKMSRAETSKVIAALEGMLEKRYKART